MPRKSTGVAIQYPNIEKDQSERQCHYLNDIDPKGLVFFWQF